SNARVDDRKLAHMNMAYLLEQPADRFTALAREHLARREVPAARAAVAAEAAYFREVMLLCQPKLKGVEELPAYAGYFFTEDFAIDAKVREKVFAKGDPAARLRELRAELPAMDFSRDAAIEESIKALAARGGFGFGDSPGVARLALSGTNVGPSITGRMRVLGRERVVARFDRLLAA
ncbi:MAG: glutamate--tRNA ligase, partial [Opitutaceae bacterium]